jgi:hypothetical protein
MQAKAVEQSEKNSLRFNELKYATKLLTIFEFAMTKIVKDIA